MKLTFYVKPTEEHSNKQGEYPLIREGILYLFTGKDYDSTPENEKCSIDLSKLTQQEKDEGSVKCEIDTQSIIANLKVELHNTDNYRTTPINKKTPLQPIIYTKITYPATLRFQTREQSSVLIGLIKAYKIPHFHYNNYGKVDINNDNTESIYSWKNEIYTIDTKQTIRLKAFVYEEQKTIVEKGKATDSNTQQERNYKEEQGNITKIIKDISNNEAQNIKWVFKIVNNSYHGQNVKTGRLKKSSTERDEPFPPLGNKDFIINLADKNSARLDFIPKGYVEIEGRYGTILELKLIDLFDKRLLMTDYTSKDNNNKQDTLINKNIIFFAYDKNEGLATPKGNGMKYEIIENKQKKVGIYNAYARYAMKNYNTKWSNRKITQDRVTSIELKIFQTRFRLEFNGQTLQFLENERVMGEWLCKTNATTNIQEKDRDIDLHLLSQSLQEEYIDLGNDEIKLIKFLKDYQATRSQQAIKLCIKPQKRVLILIERFKETTESTLARMNIFIDGKRVDSNGKFIEKSQGNKEYEMFNPFSLPNDENNYAYILERNGPDSIAGEVNLRIPEGRYGVVWHTNDRPLKLHNIFVKKERLILIHIGNTPKDSEGCLLIGNTVNDASNIVYDSTSAMKNIRMQLNNERSFLRKYFSGMNKQQIFSQIEIMIVNKIMKEV
ncbi:DUF5675 family protein [Helicobacter sp. T3_23-1056]